PRSFLPERFSNADHTQAKPKPRTLARIRKSSSFKTFAARCWKVRFTQKVSDATLKTSYVATYN
ncbi:hypothetical protein, partial [Halovulum sp. GXIMD14793]